MNWKVTAGLVVAALLASWVFFDTARGSEKIFVLVPNPFAAEEEPEEKPPWFYQVSMDDIVDIAVQHRGDEVAFYRTEQNWWSFVDPPKIPPDLRRWGGIVLLLSGPQTRRDLKFTSVKIEDPAEFGLDDPQTVVDIGLRGGRFIQFRLGSKTTDGGSYYAQVDGFDEMFLIVDTWGDVISRLAQEPPIPKWYPKRRIEDMEVFNVVHDNPADPETPAALFRPLEDQSGWGVRWLRDGDEEPVPVDAELWKEIAPLIGGPPEIIVDGPLVEGGDFSPWGIDEESAAFEFRFLGITDQGTEFLDGYLLRIGDKSPDGRHYYGKPEDPTRPELNQEWRLPLLLLDAEWTETLLDLAVNVPSSSESGDSSP